MRYRFSQLMLAVPLLALAMRVGSSPTANLSYMVLAVYALRGRAQAVQSLALTWLFLMINNSIAPPASLAAFGRYAIFFAAGFSMIIHKPAKAATRQVRLLLNMTITLGIFLIVHSLLFSSMVDVSLLKAISWALVATSLVAGWSGVSQTHREILQMELFALLALTLIISVFMLLFSFGYARSGGFQGVLNNPQAFGLTMAILAAWSFIRVLEIPRPPWALILMVAIAVWLVILSQARTGAVAFLLGISATLVAAPVLSGRRLRHLAPGIRSSRVQVVVILTAFSMIIAWPMIAKRADQFMAKRGMAPDLVEAYEISRGPLIDTMKRNIAANPWLGIGFGIASAPELMIVVREPIFGLPTSAIVEKGVMPVAVLEEIGIIGFLFVLLWIWIVMRNSAQAGMGALAVFLVVLLLNMGESTLFSPGGAGLLALVLIGWCGSGERKYMSPNERR